MDEQTPETTPQGTSRRDFLKKSAVAGGAVWAAPTIMSIGPAAFAQDDGSPACPGVLYRFKFEADDGFEATGAGSFGGDCGAPAGVDGAVDVTVVNFEAFIDGQPITVASSDGGKTLTFTLPAGCTIFSVSAKAGAENGGTLECDTTASPDNAQQFSVSLTGKAISNVQAVVCCVPT